MKNWCCMFLLACMFVYSILSLNPMQIKSFYNSTGRSLNLNITFEEQKLIQFHQMLVHMWERERSENDDKKCRTEEFDNVYTTLFSFAIIWCTLTKIRSDVETFCLTLRITLRKLTKFYHKLLVAEIYFTSNVRG